LNWVIISKNYPNTDRLKKYIRSNPILSGCLGLENEGWFDPWALLCGLRRKVIELGVQVVKAEVIGFGHTEQPDTFVVGVPAGEYKRLTSVYLRREEGDVTEVTFSLAVLSAGAASGKLADMIGIGKGEGMLSMPLPVEPRYLYYVQTH
jgi:FAD-dependent oxidoreductase domain-containing protein 1